MGSAKEAAEFFVRAAEQMSEPTPERIARALLFGIRGLLLASDADGTGEGIERLREALAKHGRSAWPK